MNSIRLQEEPAKVVSVDRMFDSRALVPNRLAAGLESICLALRFRDWLSQSEENLLQLAMADEGQTFVVCNDQFVFPRDAVGSPLEDVDCRSAQFGPSHAVFHHEVTSFCNGDPVSYRALCTALCTTPEFQITFGALVPVARLSRDTEDRFGQLAAEMGAAWRRSSEIADQIVERLQDSVATLLINRTSGRIVHATRSAGAEFGLSTQEVVDREYSQLMAQAGEPMNRWKLKLENLSGAAIGYGLVELHPLGSKAIPVDDSPFSVTSFLIHSMRNRMTALNSASSYLNAALGNGLEKGHQEMLDLIQSESALLNSDIDRLDLIQNTDRHKVGDAVLKDELTRAIDAVKVRLPDLTIQVRSSNRSCRVQAPSKSLQHLLEATLLAHAHNGTASHCQVDLSCAERELRLTIHSQSPGGSEPGHLRAGWRQFADQLAERIGLELTHRRNDDHTLTSTLTFSPKYCERHAE